MSATVSQRDLLDGLRTLGLVPGDVAFLHSSLRAFGRVEGGARAVVRALLEALGPEGTLVVPTFHRTFFWEGPDQVWDREATPSDMGRISETARTWPGARRSSHAPHPVAAIGRHADDLAARRNRSDFSFDSPFYRLLELDAWVVLMGVGFPVCTLLHLVEEIAQVPYRRWIRLEGTVILDGAARRASYPFYGRYPGVTNDFQACGRQLEEAGRVAQVRIGNSPVRAVRARALYAFALGRVRQDPLYLVSAETRCEAARHAPHWGRLQADQVARPLPRHTCPGSVAQRLSERLHVTRATALLVESGDPWTAGDGLVLEPFELRGGVHERVPGMLAWPASAAGPLPAVICLHGTGENWQWLMEEPLSSDGVRLRGWARHLARRGYATLAITQYSHPPRLEPWDWSWSNTLPAHGHTSLGRLVSDVLLALDLLVTRPEVDPRRIACAGFSLGGITSFYSLAVDPRLAAAAVFCGGVGSVRRLLRDGQTGFHSVYFYPHGLVADGLDHPGLVPALAPRALLLAAATEDQGMPLAGVTEFAEVARQGYAAAGAVERFELLVEEGGHAMTRSGLDRLVGFLGRAFA